MTVYVEYVLINNLVIDYLLLKLTFVLTGKNHKRWRVFLCAILGGVFSLIFPLIKIGKFYLAVIKVLFGILLLFLSVNFKGRKEYYVNLAVFCMLTFLLGGAIFGVYFILGVSYSSEIAVAMCFLPAWGIIYALKNVVSFLYRRREVERVLYPFELTLEGEKLTGRGFLDTGNTLYYNDIPVVVCEMSFIKKLLGDGGVYKKLKKMRVQTANGEGERFCLPLEEIKIFIGDKPNIYTRVVLMIARIDITGADLILHPALVGVKDERENDRQVKEVS